MKKIFFQHLGLAPLIKKPITNFLLIGYLTMIPQVSLTQNSKIDSLVNFIDHTFDDSAKVTAMKALSSELWLQSKRNAALTYIQRALSLGTQLKLSRELTILRKDIGNFSARAGKINDRGNPALTDSLKSFSERISSIEEKQKSLSAAIREYSRRSISFSDDELTTARSENEQLSLRQQAALQHFEDERHQRNLIVESSLIIIVLLTLGFFQFHRRKQEKSKLEVHQLKNKFLRAQLNPHFIFNALNSIRGYIRSQPAVADNYLTKFSILMRQVLENSEEEKITLEEEIAMLENYMLLESMLLPDGFDYAVFLNESTDAANTMVPPLIFQPMIENAIKHGLEPLNRRGSISLRFSENHGLLETTIADNGIGLGSSSVDTKTTVKKRSMGMQITRERIELINKKSRLKGWLEQQLNEEGSNVRIAIPV